jgi:hypothetical protein
VQFIIDHVVFVVFVLFCFFFFFNATRSADSRDVARVTIWMHAAQTMLEQLRNGRAAGRGQAGPKQEKKEKSGFFFVPFFSLFLWHYATSGVKTENLRGIES